MRLSLCVITVLVTSVSTSLTAQTLDNNGKAVFFWEHIEPILKQHCFECHSADSSPVQGELRLDYSDVLRTGGATGPAVEPGQPDRSLLIRALMHGDGLKMPPDEPLSAKIVNDFKKWIADGAVDPRGNAPEPVDSQEHWAFQPIQNPAPPDVGDEEQVRNDIDRFILHRLKTQGIHLSPEADPATLVRRLSLDLTGLPPSPEEVDEFLNDTSRNAYANLVSRLLDSPHHGERWGRHWLDAAHYGDSDGYEKDAPRPHAWRWREWVVNAINSDMPFDQFTIQQLAGDLLPDATTDQRIATGFQRNTLLNTEGGVDREEDRVKRTVDRTNTVGKVWLGLTLGCCQCHSHKYDPFTQDDYYSFYAFFNSLTEPDIPASTPALLEQYAADLSEFQLDHQAYLNAIRDYRSETLTAWEATVPQDGPFWHVLNPKQLETTAGTSLSREADRSVFATGPNNARDTYVVVSTTQLTGITAVRLEVLADSRLPQNGPGLADNGNFVLSTFRVFVAEANQDKGKGRLIPLKTARATFSQTGRDIKAALVDDGGDGWAIYPEPGKDHTAVFELAETIGDNRGVRITIELDHQRHPDHQIGKFRLSITNNTHPVPIVLHDADIAQTVLTPPEERTGQQQLRLLQEFDYTEPGLAPLLEAEAKHRTQIPKSPVLTTKAQTVAEDTADRRETRVHLRGDFLNKGGVVQCGTPAVLPPLTASGATADRLDLAHWLVGKKNPLTSRVLVNRVWQRYFGRGLVATEDDFGTQGDPPSHPELLDWLATWFREHDWSMKALHRLIVTSATYRQSSTARPDLIEGDPYNILLARQNRLRVESEIVRDLALTASGLLTPTVGGPNVYPTQGDDHSALGFNSRFTWPDSTGKDRYRRGLYTFFKRTTPYPMFMTFDSPDSNTSCTRRDRSNTPLQALTMWNDPVFVECAQALAQVAANRAPTDARVSYIFRRCLGRHPAAAEQHILEELFHTQHQRYADARDRVSSIVGDRTSVEETVSGPELAALVDVARAVMNLDEFITRE